MTDKLPSKISDEPELVAAILNLQEVAHKQGYEVVGALMKATPDGVIDLKFGTGETLDQWKQLWAMAAVIASTKPDVSETQTFELGKKGN